MSYIYIQYITYLNMYVYKPLVKKASPKAFNALQRIVRISGLTP